MQAPPEALEFDMNQTIDGTAMCYGTECSYRNTENMGHLGFRPRQMGRDRCGLSPSFVPEVASPGMAFGAVGGRSITSA